MNPSKPSILVTNDDGIDSPFIHALVRALTEKFSVTVAAPKREQSWIGRAISRRREVSSIPAVVDGATAAWAIDGTPTDCVNIALSHLCPARPVAVVSGINIGFNCCLPLLLSSGTFAGALEGASWGLPSLAFSLHLDPAAFAHVQRDPDHLSADVENSLCQAAIHATRLTQQRLDSSDGAGIVDNINFPSATTTETLIRHTKPARINPGSLFRPHSATSFHFHWGLSGLESAERNSDIAAINDGYISHSRIDIDAFAL